jgi:protein-tyrosine phosphatase
MIDLHIHILHDLDDGPADLEASVGVARAAVADGVTTVVATPHIRADYPFPLERIEERASELRAALVEHDIPVQLLTGGELSLANAGEMSDDELRLVSLGGSTHLLVESPYGPATDMLERMIFDIQARGFQPVLAHPERSPSFQDDVDRLATMVERGVLCSITAASMAGDFGRTPRRAAIAMLRRGLVHDVASDAHSAVGRPPGLLRGFSALEGEVPGIREARGWYTDSAPAAMLVDQPLPPRPLLGKPGRTISRLLGRRRLGVSL